MKIKYVVIASALTLFASCGGSSETKEEKNDQTQTGQSGGTEEQEAPVVELSITGNDQMLYDKKTLEVPAGSKVKLTLTNVGTMPKESMGHNWTLLEAGVDLVAYATASIAAKDNDYQAPDRYADVLAKTKMLGPGESETIEFDAPPAGTYKFLCTFPGHYGTMQGDFIVK